ncbi:4'-phosphopantetheinyl transferase family protein [Streptomyces swartbergensis]|uniref:4'-phosphopantetheinyl transferase family protein n=1 Tax=Streptomyces swartbergensis TaxID=487165 RepID=UPI0038232DE4
MVTGRLAQWTEPAGGRSAARLRSGAVRRLGAHAVAAVLGCGPQEVEVGRAPGGRPYPRGIPGLELSLCHTGALLVVGLSGRGRIGVDAEPLDRRVYGSPVMRETTLACEREFLAGLPAGEREAAAVRLWTLKEAYVKAIGVGLRLPFTAFGFGWGPGEHGAVLLGPDGSAVERAERERWRFVSMEITEIAEGHVLSCAVRSAGAQTTNFS